MSEERRKGDSEMRDMLVEVHTDMKHLIEWNKAHKLEDDNRHKELKNEISWHSRILYGLLGAFALVEVLMKWSK